jgi:putative ABC transport system permease protein
MVMMMPPAINEEDNLYVKIAKNKVPQALAWLKNVYAEFDNTNSISYSFLNENFAKQYAAEQKQQQLSVGFTVMAFVIACLGLLGLVMFTTVQRTKEIGIRKVLGASVSSVILMLSKEFMQLVAIAAAIAIPVGWFAMNKWLQDFAYHYTNTMVDVCITRMRSHIYCITHCKYTGYKSSYSQPFKKFKN